MAHLFALLATRSPDGLLLKRGPGKSTGTIGWDRRTDSFALGQWVRKVIAHTTADLSPDGKHLLYFVNDGSWFRKNHAYRAISRAPWLKALAFWGSAPRTYGPGAGLFFNVADGGLRVRASSAKPDWDLLGIQVVPDFPDTRRWTAMAEPGALFFVHLQRDGWEATTRWERASESEARGQAHWRDAAPHRIVFEKAVRFGWRLRQTYWAGLHADSNRGVSWQAFALVSPSAAVTECPSWEWADDDPDRNRVVWTEDCVLQAAGVTPDGLGPPRVLLDTRAMTFEAREAPY